MKYISQGLQYAFIHLNISDFCAQKFFVFLKRLVIQGLFTKKKKMLIYPMRLFSYENNPMSKSLKKRRGNISVGMLKINEK